MFVVVCISVFVLVGRLNGFSPTDEGAIVLNEENSANEENGDGNEDGDFNRNDTIPVADGTDNTDNAPEYHPSMVVTDGDITWGTSTQVELFHIFYEDGEQSITVQSDNGDNVIAPGTENSYTFKLKNTGDVALDYIVTVDAHVTPAEITIPVTARLNRYDSTWIVGGQDTYVDIPTFNTASDEGTVGAGKFVYYTLDWVWPFESGDDVWDTMLGDLAVEQDVTLTLSIATIATISDNPDATTGLTPPQTGDDNKIALWYGIAILCVVLIILLVIYQAREKYRAKVEARSSEKR